MAARLPGETYWKPGDITWQFYRVPAGDENVRLWGDSDGLAGIVAFEPPVTMAFDVRAGIGMDSPLLDEMLEWVEQRRRATAQPGEDVPRAYTALGHGLSTLVLNVDAERIDALARRGYARAGQGGVHYALSLEAPITDDELPPGMRLRHPTEADVAARAELHREAWSVWGPSQFSEAAYRELRAAPLYDPELDVVLEDADGRLLSYCVCWADEETGIGHFEPVGTHAAFAQRGLGKLVIREGLRRLQRRGMRRAMVGTASVNTAAQALYLSCGFERADREHYWSRA
jgi:ribosomal protein S18 acetylase RimI-like enzyme